MTSSLNHKGTLQLVNMDSRGPSYQSDVTAQNPVGCITRYNGNLYRYVQFSTGANAVASVAGAPCYWYPNVTDHKLQTDLDNDALRVTSDFASDVYTGVFAGVLLAAGITTLRYIWILVAGVISVVVDSASKGDKLTAAADSTFTGVAQGTAPFVTVWGAALEDRSATVSGKATSLIYPKMVW